MASLLSPQTFGKALCLLCMLTLMVFLPTWVITNCIHHPEDLGTLKTICSFPSNETATRQRRESNVEDPKDSYHPTDKMLLQYKYSYAQKSGYDTYWVCSKLHPITLQIPLLAAPVNITQNLIQI